MSEVNFGAKVPSAAPTIDVAATVQPQPVPVPVPAPVAAAPVAAPVAATETATATAPAAAPVSVPATTTGQSTAVAHPAPVKRAIDNVILPRINIAQNIGALKDAFKPGSIVYDQSLLLFLPPFNHPSDPSLSQKGTEPLDVVFLNLRPDRYVEKVPGGGRGMIVNTEAEVTANGGTLDWNEWKLKEKDGMKKFEPLAEALIAIRLPKCVNQDSPLFAFNVDGYKYALAIYGMKGMSYTAACKKVLFYNRGFGYLQNGYHTRNFSMTARWKPTQGTNGSFVPVLLPGSETTPAFQEWALKVLAAPLQTDDSTGAED